MASYQRGETVILSCEVKDSNGNYADPATSMTVTVKDPNGTVVVNEAPMTRDSLGKYHYDYTSPTTTPLGTYQVRFKATDGSRITIGPTTFVLED